MQNKARFSNKEGKEDNLLGWWNNKFEYSTLGKFILNRILNNRDVKILVTSHGNTTGTGKTQLATMLARVIERYSAEVFERPYDWNAEEHSFVSVYEYLQKYKEAEKGRVLLTDEIEYMADRRRSMSHQNVHFSQAWQILRYKNVITIGTAPSLANLDKRLPENTDIWINVMFPGYANVYYMSIDDFTHQLEFKRLKQMGYREIIRWKAIDGDPDYEALSDKKQDIGIPGMGEGEETYDKEDLETEKSKTKSEITKDFTLSLLNAKESGKIDVTQEEIADMVGMSQQYVSKMKREHL